MANSEVVLQIKNELRAKIISLELKDGDRLTESRLAEQYRTSRPNVKEALKLLENEHLAQYVPLKGYFVIGVSDQLVEELSEIRQALERIVFKKCLEVATDGDIAEMRHLSDRYTLFVQNNMAADANEEAKAFYQKVYGLCPYKRVTGILETYGEYIESFISISEATRAYWQEDAKNFSDLVTALERRDEAEVLRQIDLRNVNLVERKHLVAEKL